MMTASKVPGRTVRKKKQKPMWYAAMHETNLALCLAGGFLDVRSEQSASKDHHSQLGGVVFSKAPVSGEFIKGARGDIDYGAVCLAEVEAREGYDLSSGFVLSGPVPISKVKRVIFQNDEQAKDFLARVSGYGDVPEGIVEIVADPSLFSQDLMLENLDIASTARTMNKLDADIVPLDKLAGSVAAVLATCRQYGEDNFISMASVLSIVKGEDWHHHFIEFFTQRELGDQEGSPYESLVKAAITVLGGMRTSDGFNPIAFIDQLEQLVIGNDQSLPKEIEIFLSRSRGVLSAQMDLSDDAFTDAPVKIIPRALLLFSLNPGWDRLSDAFVKINSIGYSVRLLSAFLSGLYTGLTSLPVTAKAPDREAFLGLSNLAFGIYKKEEVAIKTSEKWDQAGNGSRTHTIAGYTLFSNPLHADKVFLDLHRVALDAKFSPIFDQVTGQLSFSVTDSGAMMVCTVEQADAPYFPREKCIRIISGVNREFTKKEIDQLIFSGLFSLQANGVFVRVKAASKGKKFVLELYAYCPERLLQSIPLVEMTRAIIKLSNDGTIRPTSGTADDGLNHAITDDDER